MLVVPIAQNSAWFDFNCEVDGITLGFEFKWNDRSERWFLDLSDAQGNVIALSIPVVNGESLTQFLHGIAGMPTGDLFVFDTTDASEDPTFDSLGRRHVLMYAVPGELGQAA